MTRNLFCILMLVFTGCCYAQTGSASSSHELPLLISGALPGYPPIARAAAITGSIKVRASLKDGRVVETNVLSENLESRGLILKSDSPFLTLPTVENLKSWRFNSDVNDTIVVTYTYDISGAETDQPTNPRVEMLPSLDVNITARPVKPTVNY